MLLKLTKLCEIMGSRSSYNSMGYLLLALLLANHSTLPSGAPLTSWDQLDQAKAALPPALRLKGYRSTKFFTHGRCSNYSDVIHYFDCGNKTHPQSIDMRDRSCLNGWGFGNLGISAKDSAAFFYDLLGPEARVVRTHPRLRPHKTEHLAHPRLRPHISPFGATFSVK